MASAQLLSEAVTVAEGELILTDDVITGHLRPALVDVGRDLARLAAVLPDGANDRFLSSPSATRPARQAWSDLEHLAVRYEGIMRAHGLVAGRAEHEDVGEWAWADNLAELWPDWRQRIGFAPGNHVPPWPTDRRERLLWLAQHGAQLVVLTAEERAERFQRKYGDRIAELQQHHRNAQAFGAMFT